MACWASWPCCCICCCICWPCCCIFSWASLRASAAFCMSCAAWFIRALGSLLPSHGSFLRLGSHWPSLFGSSLALGSFLPSHSRLAFGSHWPSLLGSSWALGSFWPSQLRWAFGSPSACRCSAFSSRLPSQSRWALGSPSVCRCSAFSSRWPSQSGLDWKASRACCASSWARLASCAAWSSGFLPSGLSSASRRAWSAAIFSWSSRASSRTSSWSFSRRSAAEASFAMSLVMLRSSSSASLRAPDSLSRSFCSRSASFF